MGTLLQDVRHGLRMLGKGPSFTLTVAVTLGLGIGANAAVFSIINTLLLRPLPVSDFGSLHVLAVTHQDNERPHNMSWLDYADYRDHAGVFGDVAAYQIGFAGLSADTRAGRIAVSYVTGNFFSLLGITPGAGRLIQPSEGHTAGSDPVIVLGRNYWKKRFNADPGIVGRPVLVNGQPFTVVGVVPEGTGAAMTQRLRPCRAVAKRRHGKASASVRGGAPPASERCSSTVVEFPRCRCDRFPTWA